MPTKRQRRPRHVREDLPEGIIELLKTGDWKLGDSRDKLKRMRLYLGAFNHGPRSELAEIWRELKPSIMRSYRGKRTKPWAEKQFGKGNEQ